MSACNVEEPEVRFNVDQYSDVTMIAKPVVYISVGEIVDTHQVTLSEGRSGLREHICRKINHVNN